MLPNESTNDICTIHLSCQMVCWPCILCVDTIVIDKCTPISIDNGKAFIFMVVYLFDKAHTHTAQHSLGFVCSCLWIGVVRLVFEYTLCILSFSTTLRRHRAQLIKSLVRVRFSVRVIHTNKFINICARSRCMHRAGLMLTASQMLLGIFPMTIVSFVSVCIDRPSLHFSAILHLGSLKPTILASPIFLELFDSLDEHTHTQTRTIQCSEN